MADFISPAEQAANEALERIYGCITENKSFRLEAGAGAGKTESLIRTLEYLIRRKGSDLLRQSQQIACITYTNIAVDEIKNRTSSHPAVHSSTIHAFCWSLIKDFQTFLHKELLNISAWANRVEPSRGFGDLRVIYENGHRSIAEGSISLHHNDVLTLTAEIMKQAKFRTIFTNLYPILLIDEYQDTDRLIAEAIETHFLGTDEGPLIGLFGDHWQKIYGHGCGKIDHPSLEVINQGANFRSAPVIVECLNRMRPSLPQQVRDPNAEGFVGVYHTNEWEGSRRSGGHWKGDLPADVASSFLEELKNALHSEGWDFSTEKTKILMLTHKVLARQQHYGNLAKAFRYSESYAKKEHPYIAFFVDVLEPVCVAYEEKRFGEIFAIPGGSKPIIRSLSDKLDWAKDLEKLLELRSSASIGEVIDHLRQTKRPQLPGEIESLEQELEQVEQSPSSDVPSSVRRLRKLREISYQEVIALTDFINGYTPFSTKHGVKGAEFENVLVVFGRGWNKYNFNWFLGLARNPDSVPSDRKQAFERNRNLFYVTISRPMKRLAILFTQELSDEAMSTLHHWFGDTVIHSLPIDK